MANESLFQGAQLPALCAFCELNDVKINWKCIDCDLIMCTTCKDKIHPKFKSAEHHRVVLLKDIDWTINSESTGFNLSDVKEYSTQLRNITSVLVVEGGYLWIADFFDKNKRFSLFSSSKSLQKVKLEGKNVNIVASLKHKSLITDIAILPSGDLLACIYEPILKQVKETTKTFTDSVFNVHPRKAICVHVTKDRNVVVGAVPDDGESVHGVVIVMDMDGNHLKAIEHDENDKFLFNLPSRIRSTKNGDLLVLNDDLKDDKIISVNMSGSVVFQYDGRSSDFCGLFVTPSENIIITDRNNDKLHILSSQGKLLQFIDTQEVGIFNPCCLTITFVEEFCVLYIGCTCGDSEKGKLYRMILSETKTR